MSESVFLRSLVDVAIAAIAAASFLYCARHRNMVADAKTRRGFLWIAGGLLAIGLFHLADILTLNGVAFPGMEVGRPLPDYAWFVVLIGVGAIGTGLVLVKRALIAQVRNIEDAQARLLSTRGQRSSTKPGLTPVATTERPASSASRSMARASELSSGLM